MSKATSTIVEPSGPIPFASQTDVENQASGPHGLNLYPESAVLGLDLESFRWQESTFAMLNLALLAALLCGDALFSEHFGTPRPPLVGLLSTGFLLQLGELIWIQTRTQPLSGGAVRTLTIVSIVWDVALAVVLGVLTDRIDSPYYVLMLVPILLCAFRRSLLETLTVVVTASAFQFYVVWHYFQLHSPIEEDEYFEAGTASLIFLLTGVVVWFLVNHLRRKEIGLAENLLELGKARGRLLEEEKLAAVGRLSAAIAHEIRNPVAMISSSLATAIRSPLSPGEREEMFDIAAKEADRLERLTNDFLAYAKPRVPECQAANVMDTLAYVADVCRAHALRRRVDVRVEGPQEAVAWMDAPQVQQALLNLAMNAVEASASDSAVVLRAQNDGEYVRIDLENGNGPISESVVPSIFEPFFTTKLSGTGLGLAIAHNIAHSHGGFLQLTMNTPETVRFTLTLPRVAGGQGTKKA
ncbi:MAG: HAMP domain-containing sensor histidine kinase [Terriglobales bacterium]